MKAIDGPLRDALRAPSSDQRFFKSRERFATVGTLGSAVNAPYGTAGTKFAAVDKRLPQRLGVASLIWPITEVRYSRRFPCRIVE